MMEANVTLSEAVGVAAPVPAKVPEFKFGDRDALVREVQLLDVSGLDEDEAFLVVINVANTKNYDEFIALFGHKFVEDLLSIRLQQLEFLQQKFKLYGLGLWSIGLVFHLDRAETFSLLSIKPVQVFEAFLKEIKRKLAEPVICRGIPIPVEAGIGVCDLKKWRGSSSDLLQHTFAAGQINSLSDETYTLCPYDIADQQLRAFRIISDFDAALGSAHEIELSFQPRVNLKNSRIEGAEALIRWRHPRLGVIPPSEFIPLIQRTGMIRELSRWVLQQAILWASDWHRKGVRIQVSVNLSSKNIDEPGIVDEIMALLQSAGLPPQYLVLEFSEGAPIHNLPAAAEKMQVLRNHGVSITIDDFGTGSNSFAYLQSTPANAIKIDGSLINSLKTSARSASIVRSIISLAHDMDMEVVAEGVEGGKILELLISWGCDFAQGYYLGRPMYIAEFDNWFEALSPTLKGG
jgi:EAL domain-containing protein (putative c-di-GMP-specific phosphodiesterase class I)